MTSKLYHRFACGLIVLGNAIMFGSNLCTPPFVCSGEIMIPKGQTEAAIRPDLNHEQDWEVAAFAPYKDPLRALTVALDAFYAPQLLRIIESRELPFRLRLDELGEIREVPPVEMLDIQSPGDEERYTLGETASFRHRELEIAVGAQSPWQGLIHNSVGAPMANVQIAARTNSSTNLLANGEWCADEDNGIAIRFTWHANDAEAQASLNEENSTARSWGIREGDRLHVFTSFTPGTGITLDDGRDFTLMDEGTDGGVPKIRVYEEGPSGKHAHIVAANAARASSPIVFNAWDLYETRIHVAAAQDAAAWVRGVGDNGGATRRVREGETILTRNDVSVELVQVLAHALPIDNSGDVVYARTFTVNGEPLLLREGEMRTFGAYRLRYRWQPQSPRQDSKLSIVRNDGTSDRAFSFPQDSPLLYRGWGFILAGNTPISNDYVVLRATLYPGRFPIKFGAALIVIGVIILGYARFGPPRRATN